MAAETHRREDSRNRTGRRHRGSKAKARAPVPEDGLAGFRVDSRRAEIDRGPLLGAKHRPESSDECGLIELHWRLERELAERCASLLERALRRHQGSDDVLWDGWVGRALSAKARAYTDALSVPVELRQFRYRPALGDIGAHDRSRRGTRDDLACTGDQPRLLLQSRKNADLPGDADFAAAAKNESHLHSDPSFSRTCSAG
jgi:hypothetical protein